MTQEMLKKIEEYKQTEEYNKKRTEFTPCKWNAGLKENSGCNSKNIFVMKCSGDCK